MEGCKVSGQLFDTINHEDAYDMGRDAPIVSHDVDWWAKGVLAYEGPRSRR